MIIQSHLWWYGQAIHGGINSQIHEVMEVEINEKKKKCQPKTSCEECIKKDLELYGLRRDDAYNREQWRERIRAKTVNPTSWDNGIKMEVVVVHDNTILFEKGMLKITK